MSRTHADRSARPRTSIVFGGYGALGEAIAEELSAGGDTILRTTRVPRPDDTQAVVLGNEHWVALPELPVLDAVVWAQGINANDSALDFDVERFRSVMDVNVTYVAETLAGLIHAGRLRDRARLVVVSSMWEMVGRPGKFSYTVSKAAIGGLVRAAALDLAPRGILVNAVLPGVVDTPMTRRVLSAEQIARAEAATPFGRLLEPGDVACLVAHLCSSRNTAVTGQSIAVDLGFTIGRSL